MNIFDTKPLIQKIDTKSGVLEHLKLDQLKTSVTNPRVLFDEGPLKELKESIREHNVLVPITVYKMPGQSYYSILDGERRFRCCKDLEDEGIKNVTIPANIVSPPDKTAAILYMFSIHNYRQPWEMMPTALSLKDIMEELHETNDKRLASLTGLSETQVKRCKWLLSFPNRFQNMSLDKDPKKRIPPNFWIEAYPVLEILDKKLPLFIQEKGREAIIQTLVDKKNKGKIKSIIDFRKIREAYLISQSDKEDEKRFFNKLKDFISNEELEIGETFNNFLPPKTIKTAIKACDDFVEKLDRLKLEFTTENRDELVKGLEKVGTYLEKLLTELKNVDPQENENTKK